MHDFTLEKLVEGAMRRSFDDYCRFFFLGHFFNFTFFVVLFTIVRGDLANINKCEKKILFVSKKTGSNLNNGVEQWNQIVLLLYFSIQ